MKGWCPRPLDDGDRERRGSLYRLSRHEASIWHGSAGRARAHRGCILHVQADGLAAVEPVDLKGLALLKKHSRRCQPRAGGWFPAEADARKVAEAASEMIDYMNLCRRTKERLAVLKPVAITAAPMEEFCL